MCSDLKLYSLKRVNFLLQSVAPAALFLAAKVEEQPHKLEHVIKVAHACLHPQEPPPDTRSEVSVEVGELRPGARSRGAGNGSGESVLRPEPHGCSSSSNRVPTQPLHNHAAAPWDRQRQLSSSALTLQRAFGLLL